MQDIARQHLQPKLVIEVSRVSRGSRKRQSRQPARQREGTSSDGPFAPSRIPGVRIAYVGRQTDAAAEMRAYWQSRGATFVHFSPDRGGEAIGLKSILSHADVVFHSAEDITPEVRRDLMAFCEHAEKPLIMLDESSLSCLIEALRVCCPIT